jgi:hypothetical protein
MMKAIKSLFETFFPSLALPQKFNLLAWPKASSEILN